MVTRIAGGDLSIAWHILGRLCPIDVIHLARASPRVPRILANILDLALPQPAHTRHRRSDSDNDGTDSPSDMALRLDPIVLPCSVPASVARVARAWLTLVAIPVRRWPRHPLAPCFDPAVASVSGATAYYCKYLSVAVHATLVGCTRVLADCLHWAIEEDPVADTCLPATALYEEAVGRDSLPLYCVASMVASDNARRGRLFRQSPTMRPRDPRVPVRILCSAVTAVARAGVEGTLSADSDTTKYERFLVCSVDALLDGVGALVSGEATPPPLIIDALCESCQALIDGVAFIHRHAPNGSAYEKCVVTSLGHIVRAFPQLSGLGPQTPSLVAYAVRSTSGMDSTVTDSLLDALLWYP
ncbi:hypothetical protein TW95_gp0545 [Pandoravirus inopinatum]|uniref:Uncharacterized protein n=1 Tax=Pandoravirus inopinatum TaxID=1605721 RepID=A0A0B5J1C1_9VIRU|nr:hypothetical protein TW95_gp0545 [Pandoravirus inopinatum]AJF97279.1 hypothetical protein [Pandoravirus inopinatum]